MAKLNKSHLTQGDLEPPKEKGFIRLYNMRYCPYAQRAVLVMDFKNVPYDVVNINLGNKPKWFFDKSEGGKVPTIELENGKTLSESLIVADYLDEVSGGESLYPTDPLAKALDRLLIQKFDAATAAFYKMIVPDKNAGYTPENFEEFTKKLEIYEKELVARGTLFFGGSKPGMLDLMIYPWIERAPFFELQGGEKLKLPKDRLPRILAWRTAMLTIPAIKKSFHPPEAHQKLLNSRFGSFYDLDFDFELNN